ncbi:MAG: LytTR family transcriptional regulator [Bacteroidales bacterium]|nr:LytTR family transcriptional regulator [Bacteroidales bacterium]
MSFLSRKYPWQERGPWIRDCVLYCVIVFLILFFLQPFGFSQYGGSKFLASLSFGAVTFCCCVVYQWAVAGPLQKRVKPWRIWHQALTVLGLVLFIGLCNMVLYSILCHYPIGPGLCLAFLYWTLIIGLIITALSTGLSYFRFLRGRLDALLEKTTEQQQDVIITIHDARVRGNDISMPINDLLCIEAQKNNVAVSYLKDGVLRCDEIQSTFSAVLEDLGGYDNIFQCHRSFIVNLNNISFARGNSNGYTLELGDGLLTVPVSRSYVPKLKSFIA